MYVKYMVSVEKKENEQAMWIGDDSSIFLNVAQSAFFNKEIYFYPSNPPESVWLWVIGHEKATPKKSVINRLWTTRWVFHICVGGKGYYDDRPIKKGTCFLSWPYFRHSIVADTDDPFEFYWLILRGEDIADFVYKSGFRNTSMVFETEYVDELKTLFELGMNINYDNVDIYEYTMSLVKMIFSYHLNSEVADFEYSKSSEYGRNYTSMARQLLRDSNYSLSVSEIAKKLGLSANYLGKVFAKDRGETLKGYIIRKRFETAEIFLKNGMPPTEVAQVIGYKDYTAFYHSFVSRYSMTPLQYAKSQMKRNE